ncbi:hypothetical protein K439DRAFT_1278590, partial [Ramaria rubella]
QNKALHCVCAAFKTTPVRALQIEAACLPIKHKLYLLSVQAALRFNHLGRHSQVVQCLAQTWSYSDGSQLTTDGVAQVGAAVMLYHQTETVREHTIGLGMKAEIYDAEMEGLAQAARAAVAFSMNHQVSIKHIHLYADNTSAIQKIFEAKP